MWLISGRSRAAATSKMERFVIIVNGFQPLTIITKRSILDVAAALDPPLALLVITLSRLFISPAMKREYFQSIEKKQMLF